MLPKRCGTCVHATIYAQSWSKDYGLVRCEAQPRPAWVSDVFPLLTMDGTECESYEQKEFGVKEPASE